MDKFLHGYKKHKKLKAFLALVTALALIIPSFAETVMSGIEVTVYEYDGQIVLAWQDPDDIRYSRMKITGAGKTIYVDRGVQQAVFSDLANGVEYRFRLSMLSETGVILGETVVSGIPRDLTPPGPVSGLHGIPGYESVILYWYDPSDMDLDRIRVKFSDKVIGVDKGVEQLLIDGLENGTEYQFVITAVDTSGNESEASVISLIPGTEISILVSAPSVVRSGEIFSVTLDVSAERTDIYAVQAGLEYDASHFRYSGYDDSESSVEVVHVDDSSEGMIFVYAASTDNAPITGSGNRIIKLIFKAEEVNEGYTGWFRVIRAMAGTSSGAQIPVSANSVQISIVPKILPEVSDIRIKAGNESLTLYWKDPENADFKKVIITVNGNVVYEVDKGVQQMYIGGLVNGQVVTVRIQTEDEAGNRSEGVIITGIPGIPGDLNYNGVIDAGDLAVAVYHYMVREGDPGWDRAKYCDVTGTDGEPDGIVDMLDITFIAYKILENP